MTEWQEWVSFIKSSEISHMLYGAHHKKHICYPMLCMQMTTNTLIELKNTFILLIMLPSGNIFNCGISFPCYANNLIYPTTVHFIPGYSIP